jgi:hypothetical protein
MLKKRVSKAEEIHSSVWFKIIGGLASVMLGILSLADFLQRRQPVDITGEWRITFEVKESSYSSYIGGIKNYKIFFTQKNQEVIGEGESWEFDTDLNFGSHVPLEFEGKIDKYDLLARYTLHGTARTTVGAVNLEVNQEGNYMSGDFVGTAADAKGIVKAYKL